MMLNLMLWVSLAAQAGTLLDTPFEDRPPIRANIKTCTTYLATAYQVDDGVGIAFASNRAADVDQELARIIDQVSLEPFRNARFWVLGVPMSEQRDVERQFQEVLTKHALESVGARVRVLSVPKTLSQKFKYFWYSPARDYQGSTPAEIGAGLLTSVAVESPGLAMIAHSLSGTDAALTIGSHVILETTLVIYTKSLINWLLRSSADTELGISREVFLKQLLLSVIFVANYNVAGNAVEIAHFISQEGLSGVWAHPLALAGDVAGQLPTTIVQALFFSEVVSKGLGRWMNGQVGDENARAARSLRFWIQLPFLTADALSMAAATTGAGGNWVNLGPVPVNGGEVGLGALVAGSIWLFNRYPNGFDRLLPPYIRLLKRLGLNNARSNATDVQ